MECLILTIFGVTGGQRLTTSEMAFLTISLGKPKERPNRSTTNVYLAKTANRYFVFE